MAAEAQTVPKPFSGPVVALFLSALVLPGLGQILTGRLGRGALMAGAVALWMPVAVIKAGRDISKITPDLLAKTADGSSLGLSDIQAAMNPMAGDLIWIFLPLITIWFWALADSILYLIHTRKKA